MLHLWEKKFEEKIATIASNEDPAHDLNHFKRVVKMAKKLCAQENAKAEVVVPAAWLHDFVIVPKSSPLRSQASKLSAEKTIQFLKENQYPEQYYSEIAHAIEGHSFSANIEVKTIEAKIVQDADRLDAIGAIGIARCFATAGLLKTSFYNAADPFCENREPDDKNFTIDHFYKKLFRIGETLKTESGKAEAQVRIRYMQQYLKTLEAEIV